MTFAGEYLCACDEPTMAVSTAEDLVSYYHWWRGYTRFSAIEGLEVGEEVAVLGHHDRWVLWGTHPFERWWAPAWLVR